MDKLNILLQPSVIDWKDVFITCKTIWQKDMYTGKITFNIPLDMFQNWFEECQMYETFLSDYGNCLRHAVKNARVMQEEVAEIPCHVLLHAMGKVSESWWTHNKSDIDLCKILSQKTYIISNLSIFQAFALTHYTSCKHVRKHLVDQMYKMGFNDVKESDYECGKYIHVDCVTQIYKPNYKMEVITINKIINMLKGLLENGV